MATNLTKPEITLALAQKTRNPVLGNFKAVGSHQQDISISTATEITVADTGATHIMLQNSSATVNIRFTLDGTNPTSTLGFLLEPGWYALVLVSGVTLKVIESGGTGQVDWQEMI